MLCQWPRPDWNVLSSIPSISKDEYIYSVPVCLDSSLDMILIDAVYINDSGGKVLLDYLIQKIENSGIKAFYLLDERIRYNHPEISFDKVIFIKASLIRRHIFYINHKKEFSKIFCFGNIPPTIRCNKATYTYFHQPLYLKIPKTFPIKLKIYLWIKSKIVNYFKSNTDFWIVQSEHIKNELLKKFSLCQNDKVIIIPFFPSILYKSQNEISRKVDSFIFVSGGNAHKNHFILIEAFSAFFDKHKRGELHLTIGKSSKKLSKEIIRLNKEGYPIINHGLVERIHLSSIYQRCFYTIYPSLAESFGLGIIEAIEAGCNVIGADMPYIYAVCEPSVIFDPLSVDSIINAMEKGIFEHNKPTKQKVYDEVDKLIDILKSSNS